MPAAIKELEELKEFAKSQGIYIQILLYILFIYT